MLYLVLLASLCIYKAAAQTDCETINNEALCISTSGCEVDSSSALCRIEGFSVGCCIAVDTPAPVTPAPTTQEPTLAPTCPTDLGSCEAYSTSACCPSECVSSSSALCRSEGGPGCCTTATTPAPTTPEPTTPEPTTPEPTTPEPTLAPTCPTDLGSCEAYTAVGCCPDECTTVRTTLCLREGGAGCCETPTTTAEPTTPRPTTPEPTTPEPTTPAPVTPEPTTPEPTTSTTEKSTPEPTTSTTEKSTPEPTTSTTEKSTPEPTTSTTEKSTPEPTTSTTEESETTKTKRSWPTPKPTMRSAEKWEMIHPAYKGSDGELLWHVYYGDFSNDDRFDSFRKAEQWNTEDIRPIIMHDKTFKKYRHADSQKFNQESAVITDNATSGASSYGSWLIGISAVLIVLFAVWYKYGSKNNKSEYTPLLTEEKVQYDQ